MSSNIKLKQPSGGSLTLTADDRSTDDVFNVDGILTGYKNLLINGGFDIWQRGTTGSGSGYPSVDRWITGSSGTTVFDRVAVSGTGIVCKYGLQSKGYLSAIQRVESYSARQLYNQEVTYSFWAKADVAGQELFLNMRVPHSTDDHSSYTELPPLSSITLTTTLTKYIYTFTVTNADVKNGLHLALLQFSTKVADSFTITQAQLEIGSVATNFEQRPIGLELSLCQRYYYRHKNINNASGMLTICTYTTDSFWGAYTLPVKMRISPTFTPIGTFEVYQATGDTTVSTYRSNTRVFTISAFSTHAHPFTTMLRADIDDYFEFDAEL